MEFVQLPRRADQFADALHEKKLTREDHLTLHALMGEVLREHSGPRLNAVLIQHKIHCSCCMGAPGETIEAAALMHHLEPHLLLAELNEALELDQQGTQK